jgi:hypothetical protein
VRIGGVRLHEDEGLLSALTAMSSSLELREDQRSSGRTTAVRQEVNSWILRSGSFDAVVDFDLALRDPTHLTRLLPEYDSGDHLHANDAGYAAKVDAIPLSLFEATGVRIPGSGAKWSRSLSMAFEKDRGGLARAREDRPPAR